MENQTNSKNIILNYGLILGGLNVIVSLIVYATGNHLAPHWSVGIISIALSIAFIILGIKKFKAQNNDLITWGESVKIGVGLAVVAALVSAIYNYLFINILEPDYMAQITEIQNQKMLDSGYTEEQIDAANEIGEKFSSPLIMSAMSIVGAAILGFIISAIAGAVMKKTEEESF